jgi:hypothetical protein
MVGGEYTGHPNGSLSNVINTVTTAREGNGQLAPLSRTELIETIEKLRRKARVHRRSITELNARHTEDLRVMELLRQKNAYYERLLERLANATESFNSALMEDDDVQSV